MLLRSYQKPLIQTSVMYHMHRSSKGSIALKKLSMQLVHIRVSDFTSYRKEVVGAEEALLRECLVRTMLVASNKYQM